MGKIPPYIVNLFERDHTEDGTVDITKLFSREGLIFYLLNISDRFNALKTCDNFEKNQLYFIAQEDFYAVKVGLSKRPRERLATLQTGNPNRLTLLFFYEPTERNDGFMDEVNRDCYEHESRTLDWFAGCNENRLHGEWFKPDDRSLRMLVKEGLYILGFI